MNSNLIPTPRVDKNGRTVIRHVKPESTRATKALPTAPPVPATKPSPRDAPLEGATKVVLDLLSITHPNGIPTRHRTAVKTALASYSDATLNRIQNSNLSLASITHFAIGAANDWDEATVNDYLEVSRVLTTGEQNLRPFHYNSWKLYTNLHPANNDGEYPEERLSQIIALSKVAEHMEAEGLDPYHSDELTNDAVAYYIDDDELREFIIDPEPAYKREDIVDMITTNNVYNPDQIKAMLDNTTTSLRSGVL